MNAVGKLVVACLVVFVLLQSLRPPIPSQPATAEIQAPPGIRTILESHCYSCHSDQLRLSWFDQIEPGYLLVRQDILTARQHLNFSTIGAKPLAAQKAALYEAVAMVQLGAMPLPRFLALHADARMTPDDLDAIKAYLAPWSNPPNPPAGAPSANAAPAAAPPTDLASVHPEPGGFAFDPTFEGWKLLSTTDRGDNYTMRFILGNDIAIKAARAGNISPWPAGVRFAKVAWQQQPGSDGLVHPGHFVQVELMDKDAKQYKDTDGWGWGRWLGLDLKPFGNDPAYTNSCTGCHLPVRGSDYVYTLPISAATVASAETVNTRAAALPGSLPYQPLDWNPITMFIDPMTRTMAVLFGNEQAIATARPRSAAPAAPAYPAGAVLALVTWVQRDDPHWFGARIPDAPQSVEFAQIAGPSQPAAYRRFSGPGLAEDRAAAPMADRLHLILSLPPAAMP
jgi:hypothetical protein